MLTGLPSITLVLVVGPILTPSSNPALHGVNLEVVGGPPLVKTWKKNMQEPLGKGAGIIHKSVMDCHQPSYLMKN